MSREFWFWMAMIVLVLALVQTSVIGYWSGVALFADISSVRIFAVKR